MVVLFVGFGAVAQAAAKQLMPEQVWALRRSPQPLIAQSICLDVRALPHATQQLPKSITHIVIGLSPDERSEAAYRATYVEGVHAVLEAVKRARWPLQRLILLSSTAVYPDDGGSYRERDQAMPQAFNGRILLEAESQLRGDDVPASVLRLGGIYGNGRQAMIKRVMQGGVASARLSNRIHQDDAASALLHVLGRDQAENCYNVVDRTCAPEYEVLDWLAAQLGKAPLARSGETGGKRVVPEMLEREGFVWRYPSYREGYARVLSEVHGS